MKKILSVIILAVMLTSLLTVATLAADKTTVYVTISNAGEIVLADKAVSIEASSGTATLDDALRAAHEQYGKADGYASGETEYGLSLQKLWGVENGGAYGYYVDDAMAWSLGDTVKDGSHIYAFVYSDTTYWSDAYTYFDVNTVSGKKGETVELTLNYYTYDESWNLVATPAAGMTLTLDGKDTGVKTDSNGKAALELTKSGVLSATSGDIVIVPPVCTVNVQSESTTLYVILGVCAILLIVCAAVVITKKKSKK